MKNMMKEIIAIGLAGLIGGTVFAVPKPVPEVTVSTGSSVKISKIDEKKNHKDYCKVIGCDESKHWKWDTDWDFDDHDWKKGCKKHKSYKQCRKNNCNNYKKDPDYKKKYEKNNCKHQEKIPEIRKPEVKSPDTKKPVPSAEKIGGKPVNKHTCGNKGNGK